MRAESYRWVEGTRFQGDVEATGAALAAIRARQGAITAPAVVEAARKPESALHRYFEWDDARAAQQQREAVANDLVRSIEVVSERPAAPPKVVIAKVTSRPPAAKAPSPSTSLAERGRGDLNAWIDRYEEVPDLRQLVADVRTALRRAYGMPDVTAGSRRPAA